MSDTENTRSLRWNVLVALGVGVLLFVLFVLPAEFGKDPTGVGEATGLTQLADHHDEGVISQQSGDIHWRVIRFELQPYEKLEIKMVMDEAAEAAFDWRSDSPLEFDFHGEESYGSEDAFTYDVGDAAEGVGVFAAPFSGEHGWFFENRGTSVATVSVKVAGFFNYIKIYRDGHVEMLGEKEGRS